MPAEKYFLNWWKEHSDEFDALLFDVDGTLIAGRHALPGATELIKFLRITQTPFALLTNDGNNSPEEKSTMMHERGLDIMPEEIVSCGHALQPLAERKGLKGERFFIMGELGTPDFAEIAGIIPERDTKKISECTGIIVGEGSYDWQKNISAVLNFYITTENRTMIVPNPDSYWPAGRNGEIGVGAGGKARFVCTLLREYGIKVNPLYLGKPYTPAFQCAIRRLKEHYPHLGRVRKNRILMLGDSLLSDIRGAKRAGYRSGLLLTGVTGMQHLEKVKESCRPDYIFSKISKETE